MKQRQGHKMKSKDKSTLSLMINFGTVFLEPPCLTPLVKNVARKWRWWNIPKFSFTQLTEVNNISVWRNPSQFLTIHKGLDGLYQPHLFFFGCAGFLLLGFCCIQHASKFGKLSSDYRTEKGQFSFQSQRKAIPKNVQTTTQLHSSHKLAT